MNNFNQNTFNYFKTLFLNKKMWLIKLISLSIVSFIVLLIFFLIRNHFLNSQSIDQNFMGDFISIHISFNRGVSFSLFQDNSALVYFFQIFFVLVFLIISILVKDITYYTLFIIIGLSGLCNVIDRAIPDLFAYNGIVYNDTVVDYFYFKFINNSAIFNIADMFIVMSFIVTLFYSVWYFVFNNKNKKEEIDNENNI